MWSPKPTDFVNMDPKSPARLVVGIDTEEEFDWSEGLSRDNTAVTAMRGIGKVQDLFDAYGITPVYVIDYSIASQPDGYGPLQEIHASGKNKGGGNLFIQETSLQPRIQGFCRFVCWDSQKDSWPLLGRNICRPPPQ